MGPWVAFLFVGRPRNNLSRHHPRRRMTQETLPPLPDPLRCRLLGPPPSRGMTVAWSAPCRSLHRLDAGDPWDGGELVELLRRDVAQPQSIKRAVAAGEHAILLDALV